MEAIKISKNEIDLSLQYYFPQFSTPLINKLSEKGELITAASQYKVINQGEFTKDVYLLLAGRLNVIYANEYGDINILNTISCGEFFGEMSLLMDTQRSTSIVCSRESLLLKYTEDVFKQFLETDIELLGFINKTLIKRLAETNANKTQRFNYKHISIIFNNQSSTNDNVIAELYTQMSLYGKTHLIDIQKMIAEKVWAVEDDKSDNLARLFKYLYQKQYEYDYVLLREDYNNLDWNNAIIGQSDKLIYFNYGDINQNNKGSIYKDLKIDKTEVTYNLSEMERIQYSPIYTGETVPLIHIPEHKNISRLARYLTGNARKLVLGGGGARGLAHLGVYKALLELGIEIDFVGGTSIGSIMATMVATEWDYDKIVGLAKKRLVLDKPMKDYRLPYVSILSGNKLEKGLSKTFGEQTIESLSLPLFTVAANLSEAKIEIIDSGSITNALRSSISLPGILPPAVHKGSLMLDGGIVDNLPLNHINTLTDGPSIGVDLSSTKKRNLGYDKVPSHKEMLLNKITKKKQYKVPSLFQTIMGTLTLASNEKREKNEKKFDVLIKPDVAKFGFLNFDKIDQLIEVGYQASIEPLKEWKAKNNIL